MTAFYKDLVSRLPSCSPAGKPLMNWADDSVAIRFDSQDLARYFLRRVENLGCVSFLLDAGECDTTDTITFKPSDRQRREAPTVRL